MAKVDNIFTKFVTNHDVIIGHFGTRVTVVDEGSDPLLLLSLSRVQGRNDTTSGFTINSLAELEVLEEALKVARDHFTKLELPIKES
jgi:hypothetical protein